MALDRRKNAAKAIKMTLEVCTLIDTAIKLSISNFKSNAFSIAYGNLAKR
jgi:hypothetical protein